MKESGGEVETKKERVTLYPHFRHPISQTTYYRDALLSSNNLKSHGVFAKFSTKPLPVGAGRFGRVSLQILQDDLVGNVTAGCAKIAAGPRTSYPSIVCAAWEIPAGFSAKSDPWHAGRIGLR